MTLSYRVINLIFIHVFWHKNLVKYWTFTIYCSILTPYHIQLFFIMCRGLHITTIFFLNFMQFNHFNSQNEHIFIYILKIRRLITKAVIPQCVPVFCSLHLRILKVAGYILLHCSSSVCFKSSIYLYMILILLDTFISVILE